MGGETLFSPCSFGQIPGVSRGWGGHATEEACELAGRAKSSMFFAGQ